MASRRKNPLGGNGAWARDRHAGARLAVKPVDLSPASPPSKAKLRRKYPGLRVNRLTWRWRDDASGASGNDLHSLLAYLEEARPRCASAPLDNEIH